MAVPSTQKSLSLIAVKDSGSNPLSAGSVGAGVLVGAGGGRVSTGVGGAVAVGDALGVTAVDAQAPRLTANSAPTGPTLTRHAIRATSNAGASGASGIGRTLASDRGYQLETLCHV